MSPNWQSIVVCGKKVVVIGNVEYWEAWGHTYVLTINKDGTITVA
jgi:hypothetical protein